MTQSLRAVFVGNPNCGKTTLFNLLAGTHLKTGNYPGVTVEKRSATLIMEDTELTLIDLPGIYSLQHASAEETITRDILYEKQYDLIIHVADAMALERSMYLASELQALGKPVILVPNRMDVLQKQGIRLDAALLQRRLSLPVCPVSAKKKTGIRHLLQVILSSNRRIKPAPKSRWELAKAVRDCLSFPSRLHNRTDRLDRFLLHPIFGTAFFLGLMGLIFFLTFRIGNMGRDLMQAGLGRLCTVLAHWMQLHAVAPFAISLVVDGILGGVGSILSFLPNLVILFTLLSLLEGSGYMARIAYLADGIMHRLHLGGKSAVSLMLALGCSVPAICAARTVEQKDHRLRTILVAPFISCSARLPIYVLFAGTFFPQNQTLVICLLYLLGICTALVWAKILSKKEAKQNGSFLLLELPDYHMPTVKTVAIDVWMKLRDYLTRAATLVLFASILLWVLTHLGKAGYTTNITESFAAGAGRLLAPLLRPAGLGFWQIGIALMAGVWAKEIVVSYTDILFFLQSFSNAQEAFALAGFHRENALAMMVFCLLYVPCAATLAAIKRESGSLRLTAKSFLMQLATAYIAAMAVYHLSLIF